MIENITPDSVVLEQLDQHWMKVATFLLWKLAGREKVKITVEDMKECIDAFAPGIPVLFTHGQYDCLEFQLVDVETAQKLAAHDATMKGIS